MTLPTLTPCPSCIAPEAWRAVPGYESAYEASTHGRVRSIRRVVDPATGRRGGGRVLKPTPNPKRGGYLYVSLCSGDSGRNMSLHRVVCVTFHGPRPVGHVTRHLDGDPNHNCPSNLVYGTPADPLTLPDVDAVARAIYESDYGTNRDGSSEGVKDSYRAAARAVLDLIAAHQPVWQRVEPGTLIKEGTRYRRETSNDSSYERIASSDFLSGDSNISIDPRTIPAPEDPRVEVLAEEMEAEYPHCDDEWPCAGAERFRGAARRAIARLDAMGGEDK